LNRQLLVGGKEAFSAIINRIKDAKEEIIISMFIWRDDNIGNKIFEELVFAAERGVNVRIIKDKVGSIFEKEEENRKSFFHKNFSISTYVSQKIISFLYFRYLDKCIDKNENHILSKISDNLKILLDIDNFRYDHSKYYLIDNKYLILGGMNIEDKEIILDKKNRLYSDYMVEIGNIEEIKQFKNIIVNNNFRSDLPFRIFFINNREAKVFSIKKKILELFDKAKISIDIEMAYWGDKEITAKIIEVARKGIPISIITSKDANLQDDYNKQVMSYILNMTNNEVKVYLSERMVHSKLLCIDKNAIFFGSANFNDQSLTKLSELNVLIENDMKIIKKWLFARTEHLKECHLIEDYKQLKYNKILSFFESIFC